MDITSLKTSSLLVIIMLIQLSQTDAERRKNQQALKPSLSTLTWQERFHGSHFHLTREGKHQIHKRTISLASLKPNRPFQPCMMPGNRPGHCRHLQYCVLEDFRASFPRFLDYMCIIQRSFVGVCCPDRREKDGIVFPSWETVGGLPSINENDVKVGEPPSDTMTSSTSGSTSKGCGVGAGSDSRVVGGQATEPTEWPWMAAIMRERTIQFCGGVLITDRHVLTAAHCLVGHQAPELLVRLGEYDFNRPDETRYRDFQISDIKRHVDFQEDTYENDIAIMRLNQVAAFNSYIWPVCLPPPGELFENRTATVIGWGTLSFGGPVSAVLMEVTVPVWIQSECVPLYAQPILDTNLCAGESQGGRDSCQGDSGGPLLLQMANKRWSVIGIVSWGIRCGNPQQPGIYTRVNRYLDWIITNSVF